MCEFDKGGSCNDAGRQPDEHGSAQRRSHLAGGERKPAKRIGNFAGGQQPGGAGGNKRPSQRWLGCERQPSAQRLAERRCQRLTCGYHPGGHGDTVRFAGGDWWRERITTLDWRDVLAPHEWSGNESGRAKPKPEQIATS